MMVGCCDLALEALVCPQKKTSLPFPPPAAVCWRDQKGMCGFWGTHAGRSGLKSQRHYRPWLCAGPFAVFSWLCREWVVMLNNDDICNGRVIPNRPQVNFSGPEIALAHGSVASHRSAELVLVSHSLLSLATTLTPSPSSACQVAQPADAYLFLWRPTNVSALYLHWVLKFSEYLITTVFVL